MMAHIPGTNGSEVLIGTPDPDLIEGLDGDDGLSGLAGADTLLGGRGNDVLEGGTGPDSMDGGPGNDRYYVDHAGDLAGEAAGDGTDMVVSSVRHTLHSSLEHLTLTGSAPIDGFGNGLANVLTGNRAGNVLWGLGGNDYLDGGGDRSNDSLVGGDGNDSLVGGDGNDTCEGSEGRDSLDGGNGNDWLAGEHGDGDTIYGGSGEDSADDSIYGGSGDDPATDNSVYGHLLREWGGDWIGGVHGDDIPDLLGSNDSLFGGPGNDTLRGDRGDDLLDGGAGTDRADYSTARSAVTVDLALTGAQGTGGAGTDTLVGIEEVSGSSHDDHLTGDARANALYGNDGRDWLRGLDGSDSLVGGIGHDRLYGGGGNDWVFGGDGADGLDGGAGADLLFGEGGTDTLRGGPGQDFLLGGADADCFDFDAAPSATNVDTITDFLPGVDRIRLDNDVFTAFTAEDVGLSPWAFHQASGAVAAADLLDRIVFDQATGWLYYDRDGLGWAAAVPFAVVRGVASLTAADFFILA
jgi:serralysin